ncbi:SCO family protein [Sphingorhabdus sp. Alg239-R122]|uniref:SCO family protein n=1 Tax=Sphingorhabdus sp. Alg239-R122 TaxID=2305989 RepID=UPI0013D92E82|nr:SCO family protein [Sphingorhabdus sp. Alg239-R122]
MTEALLDRPSSPTEICDNRNGFDATTPLGTFVEYIDDIKHRPEGRALDLVYLLSEGHPLYSGRTANEVLKFRAYAMAALELTGLTDAALPYIRENLESSPHPYSIAAAACALRGGTQPDPGMVELLFKAIFQIWQSDRPVSFLSYRVEWPQTEVSSGLTEIFQTLAHFGPSAWEILPALEQLANNKPNLSGKAHRDLIACIASIKSETGTCCGTSDRPRTASIQELTQPQAKGGEWPPQNVILEDQDATQLRWNDFFCSKPIVVGFFYTRCGNPNKCTRTIHNLARIQEEIKKRGLEGKVRVCAVSYDAQFDTPTALKSYGEARNFRFSEDYRMFRISEGFDQLVKSMELEVSFEEKRVTSHRIELFVLDGCGEVAHSFVRLQNEPDKVAGALFELVQIDSAQ